MEVYGQLSAEDRSQAIQVLKRRLHMTDLRTVVDDHEGTGRRVRKSVEWIVVQTEQTSGRRRSKLPDEELAPFLVDLCGLDLLQSRMLRERLALRTTDDDLDRLHDYQGAARSRGGRPSKAKAIAGRRWEAGKSWPRYFARLLDFPLPFAGLPGSPREPDLLEAVPFVPLPPLWDFQTDLKDQALDVLSGAPGSNRGVLTLPTGAGKTRTAVESLVEWRRSQPERRIILWIAQSQELCEQAVQAFKEVWVDLGQRPISMKDSLEIARFWANAGVPDDPDVVVASIQKLQNIVSRETPERQQDLKALAERLGAVVVDEAHRMMAPSYSQVLRFLGVDPASSSAVPLLGLTATPFRRVDSQTRELAAGFHGRLLAARSLGGDMVGALRQDKVLAEPEHEVLDYDGPEFRMDDNQSFIEHFELFQDFHPGFLQEVGQSEERNRALLERLLELPPEWPTLFFGCTVQQSVAMAMLLRRQGRRAEAVTWDTRSATRRALIEEFRKKRLSVLCNYGVLTTGFDAPKVRALVVGRPTTSRVLYEQMIGRGMRGPSFGGTEKCTVIDVSDNIRFRGQLAFAQYSEYWATDASV